VTSGGPAVFVDDAAEDAVASDRCVYRDCCFAVVVGWVLVEALVWAMAVEVALVVAGRVHPAV